MIWSQRLWQNVLWVLASEGEHKWSTLSRKVNSLCSTYSNVCNRHSPSDAWRCSSYGTFCHNLCLHVVEDLLLDLLTDEWDTSSEGSSMHLPGTGEHQERTTTHLETVLCPNDECAVSNSHCRKHLREHEEYTPLHLLALRKIREKRSNPTSPRLWHSEWLAFRKFFLYSILHLKQALPNVLSAGHRWVV